eukprot:2771085-Lingulodinium_polyedra.AAC.1
MARPASLSQRPARMRQLTGPMPSPLFKYTVPKASPPRTTAEMCLSMTRAGSGVSYPGTNCM